jgi:hypothetical protein
VNWDIVVSVHYKLAVKSCLQNYETESQFKYKTCDVELCISSASVNVKINI